MHSATKLSVILAALCMALPGESIMRAQDRSVRVHEARRDGGRPTFVVELPESDGRVFKATFSNATLRIKNARPFADGKRIVVLGEAGAADMITVVDSVRGQAIDSFYAVNASISPTGRWVVYEHFRPKGDPQSGTVYAVYDVSLPPRANRPATEPRSKIDVGTPVFPEESRTGTAWTGVTSGDGHVSMSPIVWVRDDTAVVVDRSDFEARLIKISMRAVPNKSLVESAPFNLQSLIDYSKLPPSENGSRFLLAESISAVPGEPDTFIINFRPLPELKATSTRLRVW